MLGYVIHEGVTGMGIRELGSWSLDNDAGRQSLRIFVSHCAAILRIFYKGKGIAGAYVLVSDECIVST